MDGRLMGNLSSGTIWGFTIAIIVLAFTGKFGGCMLAARYAGFNWREAGTIGSLMSCKGSVWLSITTSPQLTLFSRLIELIVLNVGLSAGILTRVSANLSYDVRVRM